jgi:hypothetical protein
MSVEMVRLCVCAFDCVCVFVDETFYTEFYGEFGRSAWSMLVLSTTANYPDVALPAFYESILYTAFFIVFLAVALWLLMNLGEFFVFFLECALVFSLTLIHSIGCNFRRVYECESSA